VSSHHILLAFSNTRMTAGAATVAANSSRIVARAVLHHRHHHSTTAVSTSAVVVHDVVSAQHAQPPPRKSCLASIGFSGAGFLAAYHLGVVSALQRHGVLPQQHTLNDDNDTSCQPDTATRNHGSLDWPVLMGVSAGSLVAAATLAGIHPETTGLQAILSVSRQTRRQNRWYLDTLSPGFSLVDICSNVFETLLRDALPTRGMELAFVQLANRKLRIGLTDRRVFPPVGYNPQAALVVDTFRSVDDVLAACILSSYVPGVTGPALGSLDVHNRAIHRAMDTMQEMIRIGSVKRAVTREPLLPFGTEPDEAEASSTADPATSERLLHSQQSNQPPRRYQREICWDGGLVNAFPTIDSDTLIVSPLAAEFRHNASISPAIEYEENERSAIAMLQVSPNVKVHLTPANAWAFSSMVLSSDDAALQRKYQQGYDNATQFLVRQKSIPPPIRSVG
jgi:Patatin-like phospholipase